jgi:hypothetical protein
MTVLLMEKIRNICFRIQKNMCDNNYKEVENDIANIIAIIDSNITPIACNNSKIEFLNKKPLLKRDVARRDRKTVGKTYVNGKAIRAKNFEFTYPEDARTNEVLILLKKRFPKAIISMVGTTDRKFIVAGKNKKSIASLDKYEVKKLEPNIRTFSYDMMKKLIPAANSNLAKECMTSFLNSLNIADCRAIADELRLELSNTKILYHSEYIISCIVFNYMKDIGTKSGWEKLKIISVDSKMENYSINISHQQVIEAFRCDLVFLFDTKLFIFEFKYKYQRPEPQAEKALQCIEARGYPYKVLEFLHKNYKKHLDDVTTVVSVGIGYTSNANYEINCGMKYKESKYIVDMVKEKKARKK